MSTSIVISKILLLHVFYMILAVAPQASWGSVFEGVRKVRKIT